MKPIAVFVLVAVFSVATVAATAKVTNTHQSNQDEQSVVGVAGPAPAGNRPVATDRSARADQAAQPSKRSLKKARITPKPGLNDPN